ncbi:RidA family protein [Prosthecochloris sp. N3]|uniref:RidA family protein n=1 Tax=Prosthecochloris ethylica TaxID=2743976 RepID=A0ABR9XPI4_9CHLB|nr:MULTISPECIES: RidA family protein [Prosthecochloris]MEC9486324.1 RidA family protein [Prosthecochloris sp.]MBF0586183.1 RidA family protein [Prosthecochloris ethylica]MBF0635889.1 RidA family protein [Prosthecochloris ethylica]NUK47436.1 RidA family protein [Prosthecochloris ethylica]RNA64985.1 RidA family protein [Prosthecochloris sp. ZM_2]
MSLVEERLQKAGFVLPDIAQPAGLYQPAVMFNDIIYTSGQLPLLHGVLIDPGGSGKVNEINQGDAAHAARQAVLNALSAVKQVSGDLDRVSRIIRLTVYVASESFYSRQHIVANGASSVLYEAFGEHGRHARSAVGVAELPMNASVEVDLVAGL